MAYIKFIFAFFCVGSLTAQELSPEMERLIRSLQSFRVYDEYSRAMEPSEPMLLAIDTIKMNPQLLNVQEVRDVFLKMTSLRNNHPEYEISPSSRENLKIGVIGNWDKIRSLFLEVGVAIPPSFWESEETLKSIGKGLVTSSDIKREMRVFGIPQSFVVKAFDYYISLGFRTQDEERLHKMVEALLSWANTDKTFYAQQIENSDGVLKVHRVINALSHVLTQQMISREVPGPLMWEKAVSVRGLLLPMVQLELDDRLLSPHELARLTAEQKKHFVDIFEGRTHFNTHRDVLRLIDPDRIEEAKVLLKEQQTDTYLNEALDRLHNELAQLNKKAALQDAITAEFDVDITLDMHVVNLRIEVLRVIQSVSGRPGPKGLSTKLDFVTLETALNDMKSLLRASREDIDHKLLSDLIFVAMSQTQGKFFTNHLADLVKVYLETISAEDFDRLLLFMDKRLNNHWQLGNMVQVIAGWSVLKSKSSEAYQVLVEHNSIASRLIKTELKKSLDAGLVRSLLSKCFKPKA
jgi:hypothetical protein